MAGGSFVINDPALPCGPLNGTKETTSVTNTVIDPVTLVTGTFTGNVVVAVVRIPQVIADLTLQASDYTTIFKDAHTALGIT